jgi:hypothetical protein
MMKLSLRVLRLAIFGLPLLPVLLVAQGYSSQASSAVPGFSLTIRPLESPVVLGEGLTIAIRITNVSASPISFLIGHYGNEAVGFAYKVRDENGKSLKRASLQGSLRPTGSPGHETMHELMPEKSIEEATKISDVYQFDRPGKYTIQLSRKEPGRPTVRSNVITVMLLPK